VHDVYTLSHNWVSIVLTERAAAHLNAVPHLAPISQADAALHEMAAAAAAAVTPAAVTSAGVTTAGVTAAADVSSDVTTTTATNAISSSSSSSSSGSSEDAAAVAAPDVVTYGTVLQACAMSGFGERALALFAEMTAAGIVPNITAYRVSSLCHFNS
jgi:pentatricopeptide repeat protein